MYEVETVVVRRGDVAVVINKSDFDDAVDELFDAPPKPADPETHVLDGNAESVKAAVLAQDSIDVLMLWANMELEGKKRKTVVDAIEARITALNSQQ